MSIFGQTYTVSGDAGSEYIQKLAEFVDSRMEEMSVNVASRNPSQVAILAALNIADEFFQLKRIKLGSDREMEEKTRALISMLDEGLIGDSFSRIDGISE